MQLPVGVSGATAVEVAHTCAEAASAIIRNGYGTTEVASTKGRGNVVTEVDFEAERIVMATLRNEFPDHVILSEETAGDTRSEGWMWVVDPVDGTKNFSRAIPHFGFNLALCFESRPVLAIAAHPLLRDVYLAVQGIGAALNAQPTAVSDCQSIADAVVAIDMGYDAGRGARQLGLATHLWPRMQSLRITGSAALGFAYVASGKWDIYVHSDLQPWDIAAGLLLVREAGGVVRDRDGNEATIFSREAVAANPATYTDFATKVAGLPWE